MVHPITALIGERDAFGGGRGQPCCLQPDALPISSFVYGNDLPGRRETISQGGQAFTMLRLDENNKPPPTAGLRREVSRGDEKGSF